MTTTFIYRPRSGDRLVAEHAGGAVVWLRWPNGCRHVLGGVTLTYHAAQPRQHWRVAARRMAQVIVKIYGGVAWDEQGTIKLVVPLESGKKAHEAMLGAAAVATQGSAQATTNGITENTTRLILAGWEPYENEAGQLWPGHLPEQFKLTCVSLEIIDGTKWREAKPDEVVDYPTGVTYPTVEVHATWSDHEGQDHRELAVTAPAAWGRPSCSCPHLVKVNQFAGQVVE